MAGERKPHHDSVAVTIGRRNFWSAQIGTGGGPQVFSLYEIGSFERHIGGLVFRKPSREALNVPKSTVHDDVSEIGHLNPSPLRVGGPALDRIPQVIVKTILGRF